ncbi:hypothetical protein L0F63_001209 [Massospora cicadina]|nr:hypothetical protein L0F63_001209 [Massospora cicadina]
MVSTTQPQVPDHKPDTLPDLTPSILEEIRLQEQQELNRKLDEVIQLHPDRMPRSVYFIVANEFGERFCYNGIKPLVYMFLIKTLSLSKADAKSQFHVWVSLTNLFPIIGAAFSDSYFGKYNTILMMSAVYLMGTYSLSIISIRNLWDYSDGVPLWPVLISLYLVGIGAGGIKPCMGSHGGDQFPPSHYHLLNKFFQVFFWAINIASLLAGILTPLIKDHLDCSGTKCYAASFGLCAAVFSCTLIVFMSGSRYYRVVPPPGEFLPWKALHGAWKARLLWRDATEEKRSYHGHWLNFADDFVGAHFTEEIRLLGKVIVMFSPFILFFFLFDQFTTEWQAQVESLDVSLFAGYTIPVEMTSYINTILIIIFIPILNYLIYPFVQRRGWRFRLLDRMAAGYFFVILSFIAYNILQFFILQNLSDTLVEHDFILEDAELQNCEALLSPSGLEFAYSQVGPQMKASSASIWLLTSAFGNILISLSETYLNFKRNVFAWFYIGVSSAGFLLFLFLKYHYFIYKEDELEIYDDDEDTFSLSHIDTNRER